MAWTARSTEAFALATQNGNYIVSAFGLVFYLDGQTAIGVLRLSDHDELEWALNTWNSKPMPMIFSEIDREIIEGQLDVIRLSNYDHENTCQYEEEPLYRCQCCNELRHDTEIITESMEICNPCLVKINGDPELIFVEIPYWDDYEEEEKYTYELVKKGKDFYGHPTEVDASLKSNNNGVIGFWNDYTIQTSFIRKLPEFNTLEELELHVKSLAL